LLDDLPKAQSLLGACGYNADWFRDALEAKGIQSCISGRRSRNEPVRYDKHRNRRRSRIAIMFGRQRTGAASPLATTAARPSSSRLSSSRPLSSSGNNQ